MVDQKKNAHTLLTFNLSSVVPICCTLLFIDNFIGRSLQIRAGYYYYYYYPFAYVERLR